MTTQPPVPSLTLIPEPGSRTPPEREDSARARGPGQSISVLSRRPIIHKARQHAGGYRVHSPGYTCKHWASRADHPGLCLSRLVSSCSGDRAYGGYRVKAGDQPQSLSVAGMLSCRVPYRRLGMVGNSVVGGSSRAQMGHFWFADCPFSPTALFSTRISVREAVSRMARRPVGFEYGRGCLTVRVRHGEGSGQSAWSSKSVRRLSAAVSKCLLVSRTTSGSASLKKPRLSPR